MPIFQTRLFLRIIAKGREVYFLKIVTLGIAFACTTLLLLFSLNEFSHDRFHQDYASIVRILQRNNDVSYTGNRLSNKIPLAVFNSMQKVGSDSLTACRVKLLNNVKARVEKRLFSDSKFYAADATLADVFSFTIISGSMDIFRTEKNSLILSSSAAADYFGTTEAAGREVKLFTLGDTLLFTVAAVFEDYPTNSHETFHRFIRFDSASLRALHFTTTNAGVYGKVLSGTSQHYENNLNKLHASDFFSYHLQLLSEIYFGPRVLGEDAAHGDHYSIVILICLTALILFLALTNFINLTTLTLPYRSKELAIKKLAGTSQATLTFAFAKESLLVVGASLLLGILILIVTAQWIQPILSLDVLALLLKGDVVLLLILFAIFSIVALAPLLMTFRFTRATPNRLLSADTITFPRFKRTIMFLQLGISIFLIVASLVIRRQINYSLVKEPGRNHDQIVYVTYPEGMTNEGLANLRTTWKRTNANIVDLMATSQLPNRVGSKELSSAFYFMSVDRGFKDFFNLTMVSGKWFDVNNGDSIVVVNEPGKELVSTATANVIGVFRDVSDEFNQPLKPLKISVAPYYNYNFLCVRVLEVDIRKTVRFLENTFKRDGRKATVSFLNKRFEEWLRYQDKLNTLSTALAIISGLLSCCAIYGLSISIVRDKLKQIAIHKLCGADTVSLVRILVREFISQMLLAILIFGPATYIILTEMLRSFVYTTHFTWLDPLVPLAYCAVVILLLCGFQTLSLSRNDLSLALKADR